MLMVNYPLPNPLTSFSYLHTFHHVTLSGIAQTFTNPPLCSVRLFGRVSSYARLHVDLVAYSKSYFDTAQPQMESKTVPWHAVSSFFAFSCMACGLPVQLH